jgi:hypothetical protein
MGASLASSIEKMESTSYLQFPQWHRNKYFIHPLLDKAADVETF